MTLKHILKHLSKHNLKHTPRYVKNRFNHILKRMLKHISEIFNFITFWFELLMNFVCRTISTNKKYRFGAPVDATHRGDVGKGGRTDCDCDDGDGVVVWQVVREVTYRLSQGGAGDRRDASDKSEQPCPSKIGSRGGWTSSRSL